MAISREEITRQLIELIDSCPTLTAYFTSLKIKREKWIVAFALTVSLESIVWKACCILRDGCHRLIMAYLVIIEKIEDEGLANKAIREILGFAMYINDFRTTAAFTLTGHSIANACLDKTAVKFMYNHDYIKLDEIRPIKQYCTSPEAIALLSNCEGMVAGMLSTTKLPAKDILNIAININRLEALQKYLIFSMQHNISLKKNKMAIKRNRH